MNARLPTPPAAVDWEAVRAELAGLHVITASSQRKQLSKDFYWYSPILTAQLSQCVADLVVKVSTEDDVRQAAAVAARWKLPITVRAGGTGNYGQCVPLEGGIVLDVTQMCRVLDLSEGRIRVEAGARMHDIDLTARETGQALRMWPSTWHVASIGGFIAGGFGGIGSFRHGILRDPGNLLRARVMTVEREPRVIELVGDEIQQVHHAYGTNGVILDVEVALSPAVEWVHCTVLFPTYRGALDFGIAAQDPALDIFLLSTVESRFSPFYTSMRDRFPADRHAVFTMVSPASMAEFRALAAAHGGTLSVAGTEAELLAEGLPPAYECAFNHTTLQALKADRGWTYLQVAYAQPFDPAVVERHLALFGDDVLQHQDFARAHGECGTFGILLVRWKGEDHQEAVMREIESQGGCKIFNPHVVTIEDGGMKTIDAQQIEFKKRSDPMGLMNPGKTLGWQPHMAQDR
ncbi:FAD-binding oxidoreductase [Diaphorobacter ruginosibacter]|uniref:FAD-binding oxidoreductase n=1 Tax=Diaphorobacter ruginosibacter TaxID=1715720 RepID=A0A7G9RTZ8_9BURK|nr:FAD-binding oxidoreductase [Diaphorobacter ruginosibacter]QNN59073.1 FAD-binding oxidoreductase [Diaphorobacter ruginosibacter]